MTRVEKILLRVRDTLADPNGERWSNARLIRLLDEAQKDLCRRAKVLRSTAEFVVFDGKAFYDMPEDFLLLDIALVNNTPIPLIGHQDLNKTVDKWELNKGKVTNVVFDKQLRGKIRLYPIPDYGRKNTFTIVPAFNSYAYAKVRQPYGVVARVAQGGEFTNSAYGFTTKITSLLQWQEDFTTPKVVQQEYKMMSDFGVTTDIILDKTPENEIVNENLGVVTGVTGFKTDKFGAVSDVAVTPELPIRFNDYYGESVDFSVRGKLGYITHFVNYGLIADITNSKFSSEYGFVSNFEIPNKEDIVFDSNYGVTESVVLVDNILKIFYIKKPADIVDFSSKIEVDECFDNALKYYVAGKAFRDDIDAQNRALGDEELRFYERELIEAKSDDELDFTRNNSVQYETTYGGMW